MSPEAGTGTEVTFFGTEAGLKNVIAIISDPESTLRLVQESIIIFKGTIASL